MKNNSLKLFIKVIAINLLIALTAGLWLYSEIRIYETKLEQKWMNYYYEKIIEYQKGNQIHKPNVNDEWEERR